MTKPITEVELRQLATQLRADVRGRKKRVPHSRAAKGSVDEAYALQRQYQQLLFEEGLGNIVGYKIALTSQAMQEMVGVDHPLAGAIFESALQTGNVQIALQDFQHLGLEFELAVKLKGSLGPIAGGHNVESVASAVGSIAPAFELVEDRDADYSNIDAYSLIAENCWNAGVIIGDYRADYDVANLALCATSLTVDGEMQDSAKVGDVMGHPFEVVAWVANLLLDQGRQLEAGMMVMTGSSMKTRFPTPGSHFQFNIDGVGSISTSTV